MKKLKIAAAILVAYSVGEFVTQYRLSKSPNLKSFVKEYSEATKDEFKMAVSVGEHFADAPDRATAVAKHLWRPNRYKK